jgi:hypothetical protein
MAPRLVRFGVRSQKLSNVGWVTKKIYYLELLRVLEGTLSRWSRLHLQSLAHRRNPPTRTGPERWVMARSPFEKSIKKACAPAVGILIG